MTDLVIPPHRIQRRRVRGWRKPADAVCVSRPSRWGNPFFIGRIGVNDRGNWSGWYVGAVDDQHKTWSEHATLEAARRAAVDLFALHTGPMGSYEYDDVTLARLVRDLGGRTLCCWCPLDQPCHADILWSLANPGVAAA